MGKVKLMLETTVFSDSKQSNHSYLLNDAGTALGYRVFSVGPVVRFRTPLKIDMRGRTFKLVDDLGPDTSSSRNVVEVVGSHGDSYTVDLDKHHCSCTGFKFRGFCKHITQAKAMK